MLITVAATLSRMAGIFDELSKGDSKGLEVSQAPSEKVVDWFHARASTTQRTDLHHPIGNGGTDAAAGDHDHDGVNSKFLFNPAVTTFTDLPASPSAADIRAAVNALNAALRRLGAG